MQVVFNKYKKLNWEDYNIDESYYLNYIYKEIANITPPPKIQMQLEFN